MSRKVQGVQTAILWYGWTMEMMGSEVTGWMAVLPHMNLKDTLCTRRKGIN